MNIFIEIMLIMIFWQGLLPLMRNGLKVMTQVTLEVLASGGYLDNHR
jgi:hypothetical protein